VKNLFRALNLVSTYVGLSAELIMSQLIFAAEETNRKDKRSGGDVKYTWLF